MYRPLFKIQTIEYPYSTFFKPNLVQQLYHQNKSNRDLILKARRHGITTMIQLDHLDAILTTKDINCLTIADNLSHSHEIFSKVDYAFRYLPEQLKQAYQVDTNNISKLRLGLTESQIMVLTSGRSGSIHRLHISEYAFMHKKQQIEVLTGSVEAVPKDGYVVIESTANGLDTFYELYQQAKRGKNNWKPHFYNWSLNPINQAIPPNDKKLASNWIEEYQYLSKQYNLISNPIKQLSISLNQFYWYYLKVKDLRQNILAEYPSTDEEAFFTSSNNIFDQFILKNYSTKEPLSEYSNQDLKIYEPPIKENTYHIGVDVGEGNKQSDYSVAVVLDTQKSKVVAIYRNRIKDYLFAKEIYDLATTYNEAYVAVERNNHGHSVINSLLNQYSYRKLYKDHDDKYGFMTTGKSKIDMILGDNGLEKAIYNKEIEVNDPTIIRELTTFEVKENGSMEALDGENDDCVIALAIAYYITPWVLRKNKGTGMFNF